jgi:hypothetical protein
MDALAINFAELPGIGDVYAERIGQAIDDMVSRIGGINFEDRAYVHALSINHIRQRRNVQINRVIPVEQRLNFRAYRPVMSGIVFI